MRVTLSGAYAGMTEKNLDDPKIGAILQKARIGSRSAFGKGMRLSLILDLKCSQRYILVSL